MRSLNAACLERLLVILHRLRRIFWNTSSKIVSQGQIAH